MLKIFVLVAVVEACLAAPQFIIDHSPAFYAHPAVLINSQMEEGLPNELRNNFYKNPRIAAGLANESLLTVKEMQVVNREADKIPREKVFNILHNGGFLRR
ncbi:uncharacterized protein LOC117169276 [Belonocnema kinseyi]|uniref:uncharacterized protein LOC117169276 n=1 Tax=Belonocnema kinseyi TaxID=2817044 RepID=UPI00143E0E81|nr:uncharacterized protein LOC117169276 [Belonocnema kinseyi]XP_033211460.1 uncharacterized protein LOC117169276 [Belonocnema kinseyi]